MFTFSIFDASTFILEEKVDICRIVYTIIVKIILNTIEMNNHYPHIVDKSSLTVDNYWELCE